MNANRIAVNTACFGDRRLLFLFFQLEKGKLNRITRRWVDFSAPKF